MSPTKKQPDIPKKFKNKKAQKTMDGPGKIKKPNKTKNPPMPYYNNKTPIEITQIKSKGYINCGINVTVVNIKRDMTTKSNERYVKILFSNGKKRTIFGLAFKESTHVANLLKEGCMYEIRGEIKAEEKNKKFAKSSESTSKFDLYLNKNISVSQPKRKSVPQTPQGLKEVIDKLRKSFSKPFTKYVQVTIDKGSIYRYLGCENCSKSIRFAKDGKYLCPQSGCPNNTEERPRKICMIIRNIKLRDDFGDELGNIVAFNDVTTNLLGKPGWEFEHDEEARRVFREFIGAKVKVELVGRKAKKTPSVFRDVDLIINSIEVLSKAEQPPTVFYDDLDRSEVSEDENLSEVQGQTRTLDQPTPTSSGSFEEDEDVDFIPYEMKSKPRGLVMIINNRTFPHRKGDDRFRKGSEKDVKKMTDLFRLLKFEVLVIPDRNSIDLPDEIEQFKELLWRRRVDCSIVLIMSHGNYCEIEMVDGICVNLFSDIVYKFSEQSFPQFIGKPKIFIFQSCMGFNSSARSNNVLKRQEQHPDTLICFPTLPGHLAARVPEGREGSIFLHQLNIAIRKYAHRKTLVDILGLVQRRLGFSAGMKYKGENLRQTSHHMAIIFRPFCFNVQAPLPQLDLSH